MNPLLLDLAQKKLRAKAAAAQRTKFGADVTAAPPNDMAALGQASMQMATSPMAMVWSVVSVASCAASAYHGYKRNNSVGWAIVWGALGSLFPVITPAIALAEGFGKKHP